MTNKTRVSGKASKRKARLLSWIWGYKHVRIPKVEAKYKNWERSHRIEGLNMKIAEWEREIDRIDKAYEDKPIQLWESVNSFLLPKTTGERRIARYIFYKWGLENNISGKDLSRITGQSRNNIPKARRIFTNLIQEDPEMRGTWESFKEFMKTSNQLG